MALLSLSKRESAMKKNQGQGVDAVHKLLNDRRPTISKMGSQNAGH